MAPLFWSLSSRPLPLHTSTYFEIQLAQGKKKKCLKEILNVLRMNQDLDARLTKVRRWIRQSPQR